MIQGCVHRSTMVSRLYMLKSYGHTSARGLVSTVNPSAARLRARLRPSGFPRLQHNSRHSFGIYVYNTMIQNLLRSDDHFDDQMRIEVGNMRTRGSMSKISTSSCNLVHAKDTSTGIGLDRPRYGWAFSKTSSRPRTPHGRVLVRHLKLSMMSTKASLPPKLDTPRQGSAYSIRRVTELQSEGSAQQTPCRLPPLQPRQGVEITCHLSRLRSA